MKKGILAIAMIALFIGLTALSAEAKSDMEQTQLDKKYIRADICLEDELKWESKFHIGNFEFIGLYFGVKITGTVENRSHILSYPYIGWMWDRQWEYIEPGSTIEITCSFLRVDHFSGYNYEDFFIDFIATNVHVKIIE